MAVVRAAPAKIEARGSGNVACRGDLRRWVPNEAVARARTGCFNPSSTDLATIGELRTRCACGHQLMRWLRPLRH